MKTMKIKCLSCEALARPVYLCAAQSPHMIDVEMMEIGLHNKPINLRQYLQEKIDSYSSEEFDAVTLAYGLCGQATAGLTAREIPLVLPRAHDCITLFLGSRKRYQEEFDTTPGTYWYTVDYIERKERSGTVVALGTGMDTSNLDAQYQEYVEKFGQENADYLMSVMGAWQSHYQRAAFIDLGVGDGAAVEEKSRRTAEERGWRFERLSGNLTLIRRLLAGEWNEDFLVLAPGEKVAMSYDEEVVCSHKAIG
jgi:hypothetical protein